MSDPLHQQAEALAKELNRARRDVALDDAAWQENLRKVIASALRTREAETWEQAAQYVSDVGNPTLANAMRSWRAAQPQEPTT